MQSGIKRQRYPKQTHKVVTDVGSRDDVNHIRFPNAVHGGDDHRRQSGCTQESEPARLVDVLGHVLALPRRIERKVVIGKIQTGGKKEKPDQHSRTHGLHIYA